MATPGRIKALQQAIENAKANMGRRAAAAVGDDIPRPRPTAETLPAPAGPMGMMLTPGGEPLDPTAIAALVRKLETQGPESLDVLEGLELVRAGADPELIFAGSLSGKQAGALIRKVQQSGLESLTPEELAALRRTPGVEPDDVPAVSESPVVEAAPEGQQAPRPFFQQGQNLVGEDGSPVRRLDDERFVYEDGTVVDVNGTVVGKAAPGDLTDTSSPMADNLGASATEIGEGISGLSPNRARVAPLDRLASDFWQVTADTDLESLSPSTLRGVANRVAQYRTVGPDGTVSYDPEFLRAINYDRGGKDRLERLTQMTSGGAARPVAAIDAPATTPSQRVAAQEGLQAAKQSAGETLPEGNWAALMQEFNEMPMERRQEVYDRLASMQRKIGRGSPDTTTPQPIVASLMEFGVDGPKFTANTQATTLRAVNPFDEALLQLDNAIRSGDEAAIADARLNLQTMPSGEAEVFAAQRAFMARQQAAAELRRQMLATSDKYREAQRAALEAAVAAPPPRSVLPQGTRSPEAALTDMPPQEMPTQFDAALAAQREREARLAEQASLEGAITEDERRGIVEASGIEGKPPLLLRGEDRKNTPFYKYSRGDRAGSLSKTDNAALEQANELRAAREAAEADLTRSMYELRLAQIGSRSARTTATADDVTAAQAEVARLQGVVRQLYDAEDAMFPPRLINSSTGRPVVDTKTGNRVAVKDEWVRDESLVPKGYRIERGYRGQADSLLNKASTQQIYDDLNVAVTGARPRLPGGLERSSPDMTAGERQLQGEELRRAVLGDRGAEQWSDAVYPEGMPAAEDVPQGGRGKGGRLGGSRQTSRVQGAMQQYFGAVDPFTLRDADGNAVFTRDRAGALKIARDALARNTDVDPGSAFYGLSLEDWVRGIEQEYGIGRDAADPTARAMQRGARLVESDEGVAVTPVAQEPVSSRPQTEPTAPAADAGVSDDLAASSVDLGDVAGDDVPVAASKGGKRGGKRGGKKDAEPEAVSGADVPTRSREEIAAEIQAEAEERFRQDIADGVPRKKANANRKAYVDEQTAERLKSVTGSAVPESAAPAKPTSDAPSKPAQSMGQDDADIVDDLDPVSGKNVDEAAEAAPGTSLAKTADGVEPPPGPQPPDKKKGRGWWPYVAGAGVVGGVSGLAQLRNAGGGGGYIDIPPPPGGSGAGGGGGVGGGEFYPMPVDAGSAAAAEAAAQEAAMQRALDRIRGARASTGGMSEPYQTYQNYSIWR